jgi:hypothetical protein
VILPDKTPVLGPLAPAGPVGPAGPAGPTAPVQPANASRVTIDVTIVKGKNHFFIQLSGICRLLLSPQEFIDCKVK